MDQHEHGPKEQQSHFNWNYRLDRVQQDQSNPQSLKQYQFQVSNTDQGSNVAPVADDNDRATETMSNINTGILRQDLKDSIPYDQGQTPNMNS